MNSVFFNNFYNNYSLQLFRGGGVLRSEDTVD